MTLSEKISAVLLTLMLLAGLATVATISTGQLAKGKAHTHWSSKQ